MVGIAIVVKWLLKKGYKSWDENYIIQQDVLQPSLTEPVTTEPGNRGMDFSPLLQLVLRWLI